MLGFERKTFSILYWGEHVFPIFFASISSNSARLSVSRAPSIKILSTVFSLFRKIPICVNISTWSCGSVWNVFFPCDFPSNQTSTEPFLGSTDQWICIATRCHTPGLAPSEIFQNISFPELCWKLTSVPIILKRNICCQTLSASQ